MIGVAHGSGEGGLCNDPSHIVEVAVVLQKYEIVFEGGACSDNRVVYRRLLGTSS